VLVVPFRLAYAWREALYAGYDYAFVEYALAAGVDLGDTLIAFVSWEDSAGLMWFCVADKA
jgi:hypothetical protein